MATTCCGYVYCVHTVHQRRCMDIKTEKAHEQD